MPKRTAQSRERANQRAARDENSVINAAVADTEREIADFVLDDDALDLDGDTSLEEMGDDLEGEDDIRDAEAATGDEEEGADDGEVDEEEEDEAEVDEFDDGTDEGDEDEAAIAAQDRQQSRGSIPPHRLREETARARAAEAALAERDQRIASLEGRVDTLTQLRGPAQPQPVVDNFPATPPDAYADYEANQAWHVENTRRQTERAVQEALQQETNRRLNDSFETEATGPRSYEFHAAYDALMALPRTSPNDALKVANKIKRAPDPSAALYEWWEDNGAQEFRERIAVDLAERMGWEIPEQPEARQNGRANGRGEPQRRQQRVEQPQGGERRAVFRGPQRVTRSLNNGAGGVRQQIDPRAMDDSDAAVMDYALEP